MTMLSEGLPETWASLRSTLPEGLSDEALSVVRCATAAARHEARVLVAALAALDATADIVPEDHAGTYALSAPDGSTRRYATYAQCCAAQCLAEDRAEIIARVTDGVEITRAGALVWAGRAAALIALELAGIGGPGGLGERLGRPATIRMGWARVCGRGRRHAGDGPAWSEALRQAGYRCHPAPIDAATVGVLVAGYLRDEDMPWARSYVRGRIYDEATAQNVDWRERVLAWDVVQP